MKVKDTNQIKYGAILSYVQMIVGAVISLLYTPIMMKCLGQSEFGLYNTVSSTISMISILSLGFNSGYIKYYSKYKKDEDNESINKLNGLFLIVFSVLGLIALACGMFLSFNLNLVFKDGLSSSEYDIAKVLMILLTINLTISFPMSVFSNIIFAHERFVLIKTVSIIKSVCGPLVTLPLLLLGYRSVSVVLVTILFAIVADIINTVLVITKLKQKFIFSGFEHGLLKSIFIYTSFIAICMIVDQINWNIDKLLLARYRGTTAVAVYSVGYTLFTYYSMVSQAISGVFTPQVHRIINNTGDDLTAQNAQISSLFIRIGRIQYLVLGLVSTGLIWFGQVFIKIWAGVGYEDAYYVVLLLALPATIPQIQTLGIEIQRAQNKHLFRSIVYLFMAFINLFLSVFLCQIYGAIGSAIGTCISLIVANGIVMNVYYYKKCNIDILLFWKNIIYMAKGLILPITAGVIILAFNFINSLFEMICWILIYSILYLLSVWFFSCNEYEKNLIRSTIKKYKCNIDFGAL